MKHSSRRCMLALSLLWAASRASAFQDGPLTVYSDGLSPGWQNWSWNTGVNLASGNPAHGGAGTAIAVTYNTSWAGLYLHNDSYVNASSYAALRFWIHGGVGGGQSLRVTAYDSGLAQGTAVAVAAPVAGTWQQVDVPLVAFGLSTIGGLVWQDTSGHAQATFYLDDISLTGGSAPPTDGPVLAVDVAADRHAISDLVYGMNFADPALAAELRLPVNRWGGNGTTRYNWQNDTSNHASDWYFENIPNDNDHPEQLPDNSSSDWFVAENRGVGAQTLLTIPLIGWTPRAREYSGGFDVSRYGPQQDVDPWRPEFGNGIRPDGSLIVGNDPLDTSVAIGPAFVQAWMGHLIGRYGSASGGGVRFYNLDNEPALWNSTHRDVHPTPLSYDEQRDRTVAYASAIKATDPAARILGPAEWGWVGYFYSAADVAAGGNWWDTRPDRRAHGDVPLTAWYLQQMRQHEQTTGTRLLDYLDLHYYPQSNVALQPAGDAATQARRLRSTRSLWDPTYLDESWIGDYVRLVPRMREWVAANYPGTSLAMGEYNWGGLEHINGAIAQADVLGIFGREGLDLATMWGPPSANQPAAFAFRVFRNYDGAGASFGNTAVRSTSADQSRVSVYAAQRDNGGLTIVAINKTNQALTSSLTISNFTNPPTAQVYRYSAADLSRIVRQSDVPLAGGPISLSLPADSISLFILAGSATIPGDIDGDGHVGLSDLALLLSSFGQCQGSPTFNAQADFDSSGCIELADLTVLLAHFGQ